MKKFMKKISVFLAAALCVTMFSAVPASAATKTTKSVWSSTKEIAGATYSSSYIKWLKKYSKQKAEKTVSFKNSQTKKFFTKFSKAYKNSGKNNFQMKLNLVTSEEILSMAMKNDKIKMVIYSDGTGMAIYTSPKEVSIVSVNDKQAMTVPMTEDYKDQYDDAFDEFFDEFGMIDFDDDNLGVDDKTKGKVFKFKNGEKSYTYEEFEVNGSKAGYLYNESGSLIGLCAEDVYCCVKISTSVKNSEFDLPKGYTQISM